MLGAATNSTPTGRLQASMCRPSRTASGRRSRGTSPQRTPRAIPAKTSGDIDDWITQAGRNPDRVPDAVNKAIMNTPGFCKGVMPELQDVANTGSSVGSRIWEATGEEARHRRGD